MFATIQVAVYFLARTEALAAAQAAVTQQPFGEFAADHAGRAENENVQGKFLRFLLLESVSTIGPACRADC